MGSLDARGQHIAGSLLRIATEHKEKDGSEKSSKVLSPKDNPNLRLLALYLERLKCPNNIFARAVRMQNQAPLRL